MAITRPQLPPRAGYVEVEDDNGNRVYKPTAETVRNQEKANTESLMLELAADHEARLCMIELGV